MLIPWIRKMVYKHFEKRIKQKLVLVNPDLFYLIETDNTQSKEVPKLYVIGNILKQFQTKSYINNNYEEYFKQLENIVSSYFKDHESALPTIYRVFYAG